MRQRKPRDGFTLIELLVAIGIIAILAGLTISIGPVLSRTQQAGRGAEIVQGTLFIAKQMALRDRILYGVRLLPDPNGTGLTSMQYINQPQDYVRNTVAVASGSPSRVQFSLDISDSFITPAVANLLKVIPYDPTNPVYNDPSNPLYAQYAPVTQNLKLWPIQVGDYIQVQTAPSPARITKIISNVEVETRTPINTSSILPDVFSSDFRVMRSPRPVGGEEIVQLPDDVIIDLGRSRILPDDNGRFDILFTPAGALTGNTARLGKVVLWVRDLNANPATAREQSLITVYSQSGAIASYAVDTGSADPYSFTYDSRPSGF